MMKRLWVLLMALVLLVTLSESAMAVRWEKKELSVWDFTPEEWRPYVQATVDDFNASLPTEVPRLNYIPMGETPCNDLPPTGRRGGITVCLTDTLLGGNENAGETRTNSGRRGVHSVMVAINTAYVFINRSVIVCHEFTHAVFAAPDAPTDQPRPYPDDSCVQGYLDHLGSWDIAYAEQVYHDNGRRDSESRRHHRKKH